ncbi:MAG: hypothetical protein ACLUEQ_00450 [Cloacibacillus evryensis]
MIFRYGRQIKRSPRSLVPRRGAIFLRQRGLKGYKWDSGIRFARRYFYKPDLIFYGCLYLGWGNTQLTAVFLLMGIAVALIFGWSADRSRRSCLPGRAPSSSAR